MYLNRKEWFVVAFSTVILVPGVLYFFSDPYYARHHIHNPGTPDTLTVVPAKPDHNRLIIKVDGVSDKNYSLKLNLFYKRAGKSTFEQTHSEIIRMPAGVMKATFARTFNTHPGRRKAQILYIPEEKSARGKIRIEAGSF